MSPPVNPGELEKRKRSFFDKIKSGHIVPGGAGAAALVGTGAGVMAGRVSKEKAIAKAKCYESQRPSCCLIISNIFNDQERGSFYESLYRGEAEGELKKLRKLFVHLRSAFVWCYMNVSSVDLDEIIQVFQDEAKKNNCGATFVVISSHSGYAADSIFMDDLKEVDLYKDIIYKFEDDVRGRPKVFLVDACRRLRGAAEEENSRPTPEPGKLRDILVCHSTLNHYVSEGDTKIGSWYFHLIDQVFRKYGKSSTLREMISKVNEKLVNCFGQNAAVEDIGGFKDYRFPL